MRIFRLRLGVCVLKRLISPVNMFFYSDVLIWLEGAAVATASFFFTINMLFYCKYLITYLYVYLFTNNITTYDTFFEILYISIIVIHYLSFSIIGSLSIDKPEIVSICLTARSLKSCKRSGISLPCSINIAL